MKSDVTLIPLLRNAVRSVKRLQGWSGISRSAGLGRNGWRCYAAGVTLALGLTTSCFAAAPSSDVPGPTNYQSFSRFITDRNIFNPNRVPRQRGGYVQPPRSPVVRDNRNPAFVLAGTMSYGKGMFAFFNGNDARYRKVLYESDSNNIAGYTLAEITPGTVKLQLSSDKKQMVEMKFGDIMRWENNKWQLGKGELPSGMADMTSSSRGFAGAAPSSSLPPSAALEQNDILKKLMQQKEQESKQ